MPPDLEKYQKHVEHFDVPEEQKIDLVQMVWNMMENAVDRAFEEDSVQLALADNSSKSALPSRDVVNLSKDEYRSVDLKHTFNEKKGPGKNE